MIMKQKIVNKTSVADPDPHGSGTFAWIRIQQKVKEHINKTVNSGLYSMNYWTVVLNREWQIFVKILLFD